MERKILLTRIFLGFFMLLMAALIYTLVGMQPLAQAEVLAAQSPLQAAEACLTALEYFPWRADLYEKAAIYTLQGGQPARAIELFLEAQARDSLSSDGKLALGQAYWQAGQAAEAFSAWQELENGPQVPAGLYPSLARAYHETGAYQDELTAIQKGLALQPQNAELTAGYAILLMSESPSDAIPALEQAAALDPSQAARLNNFAATLKLALSDPSPAYQLTISGQALAETGDWLLAQRTFENAVRANPRYAPAWAWLGEARQKTGAPNALEALNQALRLTPSDPATLAMRGLYYQRTGEYARAVGDFTLAIQADPQNVFWQLALAEAYDRLGDLNSAAREYQRATEVAPTDPQAWRALALFCLSRDIFIDELAFPAAQTALKLDPNNPQSMDLMARAYLAREQVDLALPLLEKAIELAPQDPSPRFHLGLLYLQTGQMPLAEQAFRAALERDPNGALGDQARRILERYFP
jgi:tetratricopeptide (TPR) repeat protein